MQGDDGFNEGRVGEIQWLKGFQHVAEEDEGHPHSTSMREGCGRKGHTNDLDRSREAGYVTT